MPVFQRSQIMLYYFVEYKRIQKATQVILIVVIITIASLYLLRPIVDNDFFWHLKTGEWIWQNKSLPSEDPFAYTTPQTNSDREYFILTSYWLSQVIFYFVYLAGGMSGIVFYRFILIGILIYIMLKREKGDNILYLCLLIMFLINFLTYPIERPHFFSFLLFSLLLYLLDNIRNEENQCNGKGIFISLPLLMIIWANMHGGHVLGQGSIILYVVMEGLKFTHPSLKPLPPKIYKKLLIAGISGIIISFVNPNTYHVLGQLVDTNKELADMISNNFEYMSSFERFSIGGKDVFLYWLFCLLGIISCSITIKQLDITKIAFLVVTGYFSFTTLRYIPFFMIVALPFIGESLSRVSILKYIRLVIIAITFYSALFFTWNERLNIYRITSGKWISNYAMPVEAADFILKNDIKGNMFNFSDWGGYLIWRLGPSRKVFTDGRFLYPKIYSIESQIGIGAAYSNNYSGLPYWKSILNGYKVTYIIMPLFVAYGETYNLLFELLRDNEWLPVFYSQTTIIFLRDSPENYYVLRKHAIPKDYFIEILIEGCNSLIKIKPNNFQFYMAKGDLNMFRGNFKEAKEGYKKVLELAPYYALPRQKLQSIELNTRNQ